MEIIRNSKYYVI